MAQLLSTSIDTDGDALSVVHHSLADPSQGVLSGNTEDGWSFEPTKNSNGSVSLNYVISDQNPPSEKWENINYQRYEDSLYAVVAAETWQEAQELAQAAGGNQSQLIAKKRMIGLTMHLISMEVHLSTATFIGLATLTIPTIQVLMGPGNGRAEKNQPLPTGATVSPTQHLPEEKLQF